MIDFNNCTLFISARSPFARRVRLAFLEHDIKFEEKVLDVFKPNPELTAMNPLSRVPTVQLKTGNVIIDSNLILMAFYFSRSDSPLIPKKETDRIAGYRWSGIALGLYEKCIDYFLESKKTESMKDQEVIAEVDIALKLSLTELDKALSEKQFLAGQELSQADLDMGAALDYVSLRHPIKWRDKFKNVTAYSDRLNDRPSFQKTVPPPA